MLGIVDDIAILEGQVKLHVCGQAANYLQTPACYWDLEACLISGGDGVVDVNTAYCYDCLTDGETDLGVFSRGNACGAEDFRHVQDLH